MAPPFFLAIGSRLAQQALSAYSFLNTSTRSFLTSSDLTTSIAARD